MKCALFALLIFTSGCISNNQGRFIDSVGRVWIKNSVNEWQCIAEPESDSGITVEYDDVVTGSLM